jgi:hypothetical protein
LKAYASKPLKLCIMKRSVSMLVIVFAIVIAAMAQPPQAFKYQVVVRDASGDILSNQAVSLRISIHDGFPSGTVVYQETHYAVTNQFGLVNINIGYGTPVLGSFSSIDWGSGSKYLETELDPTGGSNYTSMGTTQLMSVPYALYSGNTANGDNLGNHIATQNINLNGNSLTGDGCINLGIAPEEGIYINKTTKDGILIHQVGNPTMTITSYENKNGINIEGAENIGVLIGRADAFGITVGSSGMSGVLVGNAEENGVIVYYAENDGIHVSKAGNASSEISDAKNNGVEIEGAEGNGVFVGQADASGLEVGKAENYGVNIVDAGYHGLLVQNTGLDGLNVQNADDDGVSILSATDNGIEITNAGNNGLYLGESAGDGVHIEKAGNPSTSYTGVLNNGFEVQGAEGNGLYIGQSDNDGIFIRKAGNPSNAFLGSNINGIEVAGAEGCGLYVGNADFRGVDIDYSGDIGFFAYSTGSDGVYIGTSGEDGMQVFQAGSPSATQSSSMKNGVEIAGAQGAGFYVGRADNDGVYINSAGDDGVQVQDANWYGFWANGVGHAAFDGSTNNTSDEWGLYTPDKVHALNVTSKSSSTYAKNTGTESLEPGNIICIAGGVQKEVLSEEGIPAINVTKANQSNAKAVFGIVEYKVVIGEYAKQIGEDGKTVQIRHFEHADGNIASGEYLSVIVFGQAEVNVDSKGPLKAGDALVAGNNGAARKVKTTEINGIEIAENTGILGKALESSSGKGKVLVFVNCK